MELQSYSSTQSQRISYLFFVPKQVEASAMNAVDNLKDAAKNALDNIKGAIDKA
jgi:hypothetical protein